MSNFKYTDEMIERMKEVCGNEVTEDKIQALVDEFNFNRRSVTAKLRSLNYEVPSVVAKPTFTQEETDSFRDFVTANSGNLTGAEIAAQFMGGKFTSRQIMGKVLALELNSHVKKAAKEAKPRTYTPAEEAKITSLVESGKALEDIAEALGKPLNSIRGKLLSMELKAPQKNKKAPAEGGSYPGLADIAANMTVDELVEHYKKTKPDTTSRGIKTVLSRRKVAAKDYEPKKAA
jgi:hypothetical protein